MAAYFILISGCRCVFFEHLHMLKLIYCCISLSNCYLDINSTVTEVCVSCPQHTWPWWLWSSPVSFSTKEELLSPKFFAPKTTSRLCGSSSSSLRRFKPPNLRHPVTSLLKSLSSAKVTILLFISFLTSCGINSEIKIVCYFNKRLNVYCNH